MRGTFLSVLLLLLAALLPLRAETRSVDVALVLAIDISASIDASGLLHHDDLTWFGHFNCGGT